MNTNDDLSRFVTALTRDDPEGDATRAFVLVKTVEANSNITVNQLASLIESSMLMSAQKTRVLCAGLVGVHKILATYKAGSALHLRLTDKAKAFLEQEAGRYTFLSMWTAPMYVRKARVSV